MPEPLRIGTRMSPLARWQAEHVAAGLRAAWPGLAVDLVPFTTEGDRTLDRPLPAIGGKGLFTAELEAALLDGRIDLAVHSLKDLPTDDPEGLVLGAILAREDARDAWVCPAGHTLGALPEAAVVGTSSPRRAAQLLRLRPDLRVQSIRGNVGTRIRKTDEGGYAATVLAAAGLARLGLLGRATALFDPDTMLPAPGQAALAVQVRRDDDGVRAAVAVLDCAPTRAACEAERHFLSALGGGCSAPVAALAQTAVGRLTLRGRVLAPDGSAAVEAHADVDALDPDAARRAGDAAARQALSAGAADLLAAARTIP